jgi:hypothetical protein
VTPMQSRFSSCPAQAGHPVTRDSAAQAVLPRITGSPAFAGDDDR